MKIAIVVNSAWGAYNFRFNLANSLRQLGHDVVFIFKYDNDYSEKLQKDFKCYDLQMNSSSISPLQNIKTLVNLINIYKKVKPDIVCHFTIKPNIYGSIAAKVCSIPSIGNITGLGTLFIKASAATYFAKKLYKLSLMFPNKVFFQNKSDQQYFIDNKMVQKSIVGLLPGSGVDIEKFKPIKVASQKEKFIFLLVSRLLKDKGVYEFIDAIKIIRKTYSKKQVEFQILGDASSDNKTAIHHSKLESWINDGLINYLGVTDKVEEFISRCDCVVLASYREGMPRSILEAFSMGKPAIVSNVPGCVDIVDHMVNGLICEVKSPQDLAKNMVLMINTSQESRDKMGKRGREKIENLFDEKIVINAYIDMINKIMDNEKTV